MWKKLPYSLPLFLSCTTDNGYRIYITDYINIWWVYYKENEFLTVLKKSNDDLEMDNDNKLLQSGLKILSQPEDLKKVHVTFHNKTLNISMMMPCGFPFYLDMKLTEGSKEMFFKYITQQLLRTIYDLKTSETELRRLLIKKDKEIEEYKCETDVRLAMYLKTAVFHDEEHMGKHKLFENHFGTSEVSESLLEKTIEDTEDQVIVKQENLQVEELRPKTELDSQNLIKSEPGLDENAEPNPSSGIVKREIKNETRPTISPKKKKKMFKI